MGRKSSPYYWKEKQGWYVTISGKRLKLGDHPEGAQAPRKKNRSWNVPKTIQEEFLKRQTTTGPAISSDTSWAVLDAYLEWCEVHRPSSYGWYKARLQRFKDGIPNMPVPKLKPFHVQEWLDTKTWGANYKRGMVTAIKRVFAWAIKQGHLEHSPLAGLDKPAAERREQVLSPEEFKGVMKHVKAKEFADLLNFCWEVGARPQEAVRIEKRHLDLENQRIILPRKESKGKKDERVIYLTDASLKIVKRLTKKETVHLFLNSRGRPWTAYSVNNRFCRLREAVGQKLCLYVFRHSWVDRKLRAGVDPITLATLAGHKDVAMIAKTYQHLARDGKYLLEQAKR